MNEKMDSAPSKIASTYEPSETAAETLTTSGVGVGVGVGAGLRPPPSGGPAETSVNSAHTSAPVKSVLFKGLSPIEVATYSAGFAGRTPHDTPADPGSHALWRTHHVSGRLDAAVSLCLERALLAETLKERACWYKDAALSRMAQGRHADAFELLRPVRDLAARYEGAFRGRLEMAIARAHENLAQYDPAFEHYTAGHFYADAAGGFYTAAQIDTNTGRCYTHAGRPQDSHKYFNRAYVHAVESKDILLQAEIDESRALALEAEGKLREALVCAARSLYLLAPTDYKLAWDESKATLDRIERNLR